MKERFGVYLLKNDDLLISTLWVLIDAGYIDAERRVCSFSFDGMGFFFAYKPSLGSAPFFGYILPTNIVNLFLPHSSMLFLQITIYFILSTFFVIGFSYGFYIVLQVKEFIRRDWIFCYFRGRVRWMRFWLMSIGIRM